MKMQKLKSSLSIRKINDKMIKINDFVVTQLYIDDVDFENKSIIACITIEIHFVDDLKINILVDVDVLTSQHTTLNFERHVFIIDNCQNIQIFIYSINRAQFHLKRIVRVQKIFVVHFDELINMFVIYNDELSNDRNFLFEF